MEHNSVQKTTRKILKIALVLQVVYVVVTCLIIIYPTIMLKMVGLSGNYDLPTDTIKMAGVVGNVLGWLVMYGVVISQVNNGAQVGVGQGIGWWIYLYLLESIVASVVSILNAERIDRFVEESMQAGKSLTATMGENVTGYNWINVMCGYAGVFYSAAVLLSFVGYGIYCYYCNKKEEFNM